MTILANVSLKFVHRILQQQQRRQIWGYVAIAFNKVDVDRRNLVGPNRLCAEWVLKNGGGVKFLEYPSKVFRDYNALPPESVGLNVLVVDGTDSSVMKIGLEHFAGCKFIEDVCFANCKHLESDGLDGLVYVERTIKRLQVSGCHNIGDDGLRVIGKLHQLEHLIMHDMPYVKDMHAVVRQLQGNLPKCKIDAKAK